MSKKPPLFPSFLVVVVLGLAAYGQEMDVSIKLSAQGRAVQIDGRFAVVAGGRKIRNLSLPLEYAGITDLGKRLSSVRLSDVDGVPVRQRQMAPGEYLAEEPFEDWSYTVDLTPLPSRSAAAHVSWLADGKGILMPADLLPEVERDHSSARIRLELPAGWRVITTERDSGGWVYDVNDIDDAVFYIDRGESFRDLNPSGTGVRLLITDEWLFTDAEASAMTASVFEAYRRLFGAAPQGPLVIGIIKFPRVVASGHWEAASRGRSVTIVSSDMPFKSQSVQRLHEQLRHELFHLWIPNGLNLTGNYDWFYEGFALYQSLKTGVAGNQIRFDDLLDTLSRAYDIDGARIARLSLIDASKNRWAGGNTQVYARGMLVAFLSDLALLERSKGKSSISDVFRSLYERHRQPSAPGDGNVAVIELFRSRPELAPLVERYVSGTDEIAWEPFLRNAGLILETGSGQTRLRVGTKLSGRQKALLDRLGYNNWRKASGNNR